MKWILFLSLFFNSTAFSQKKGMAYLQEDSWIQGMLDTMRQMYQKDKKPQAKELTKLEVQEAVKDVLYDDYTKCMRNTDRLNSYRLAESEAVGPLQAIEFRNEYKSIELLSSNEEWESTHKASKSETVYDITNYRSHALLEAIKKLDEMGEDVVYQGTVPTDDRGLFRTDMGMGLKSAARQLSDCFKVLRGQYGALFGDAKERALAKNRKISQTLFLDKRTKLKQKHTTPSKGNTGKK